MSVDLFRLDGSVSVVTGASGWLGRAIVEGLAAAGSSVVAVGRRHDALADLEQQLRSQDLDISSLAADVTAKDWPDRLAGAADLHGGLDILVNNAHAGRSGSMRTSSAADFDDAFGLAVTAAWSTMNAARAQLSFSAERGGSASVINVASMYGLVAPDFEVYEAETARNPPYYGAAKAALLQLTRYAAAEFGVDGIRVNAISPGPFPGPPAKEDAPFVGSLASRTMLGRVGEPDDIKTAVLFLASRHSRFVTGANIVVDGGWTSR